MIKIFCEGIGDKIFLADFIESYYNIVFERKYTKKEHVEIFYQDKIEIEDIEGCANIHLDLYKNKFKNNTEISGKNILIFDADYTKNNGNNGYESCIRKLNAIKEHEVFPIEFEHYLWPNNTTDGYFEDLLVDIINIKNKPILDCIESNIHCLTELSKTLNFNVPDDKAKINYYLHMFNQKTKPGERNYKDIEFWSLDCNIHQPLKKLKDFFDIHLLENLKL